jgi:hypothetical protein
LPFEKVVKGRFFSVRLVCENNIIATTPIFKCTNFVFLQLVSVDMVSEAGDIDERGHDNGKLSITEAIIPRWQPYSQIVYVI